MIQSVDDPVLLRASVCYGQKSYQTHVRVAPIQHDYGDGYYKYSCPICESLGVRLQLTYGEDQCPCCGVNIYWDE